MVTSSYTAFDGDRRIASGTLAEVALAAKEAIGGQRPHDVLVFDDATGRVVDLYLKGSPEEVAARHALEPETDGGETSAKEPADRGAPPRRRGRGRPKLGVVGREVTLLPRHWEWLASQPGGASAALRRLVERARKENAGADRVRRAREVAYRFLSAMAGDRPGFEEATRALFAGDRAKLEAETDGWPADVRDYALKLAAGAFPETP
jgi:hypothetical protein